MPMYERTREGQTELWVAELRGRSLWTREGRAGSKGKMTMTEAASELEAAAMYEREAARRVAEGFALVDERATVSSPFRSQEQRERARRRAASSTPAAILRGLASRLGDARTVEALAALVCAAAEEPCIMRLYRLDLDLRKGEQRAAFELGWARGRGANPDDYELEGGHVAFSLERPWGAGDDGVTLDVFADELGRVSAATLVSRFRSAVRQIPGWPALALSRVSAAELTTT